MHTLYDYVYHIVHCANGYHPCAICSTLRSSSPRASLCVVGCSWPADLQLIALMDSNWFLLISIDDELSTKAINDYPCFWWNSIDYSIWFLCSKEKEKAVRNSQMYLYSPQTNVVTCCEWATAKAFPNSSLQEACGTRAPSSQPVCSAPWSGLVGPIRGWNKEDVTKSRLKDVETCRNARQTHLRRSQDSCEKSILLSHLLTFWVAPCCANHIQ